MNEIFVHITDSYGEELAQVRFTEFPNGSSETSDFAMNIVTRRDDGTGIHGRSVYSFPKTTNALGLLLAGLSLLSEEELTHAPDIPADMERRRSGGLRKVQRWANQLRNN